MDTPGRSSPYMDSERGKFTPTPGLLSPGYIVDKSVVYSKESNSLTKPVNAFSP